MMMNPKQPPHESESEASCESSDNATTPSVASASSIKFIHSGHRRTGSEPMPSSPSSVLPSVVPSGPALPSTTIAIVQGPPPLPPPRIKGGKKKETRSSDWEVLEGLKEGQTFDRVPKKFEGFILKRRKFPLKGYHKRYFMLEKGLIVYGKNGWDVARGKVHGSMDAGLSVISARPRDGRIDIDSEDCIYHLKIKPMEVYMEWLEQLKQHRLYRQQILSFKDLPPTSSDLDEPSLSPSHQEPLGGAERRNSLDKELSLVDKDLSNLEGILNNLPQPHKKEDESKMKDFLVLGKEVVANLRTLARKVGTNREGESGAGSLRLSLNQALQQNAELKSRLNRIHRESLVAAGTNSMTLKFKGQSDTIKSYGSTLSNSEYYDAIDIPGADVVVDEDRTSSDEFSSEDEGEADSIHSEFSEQPKFENGEALLPLSMAPESPSGLSSSSSSNGTMSPQTLVDSFMSQGRRAQLPIPAPTGPEVPTLWTILRKNIGKDLSRISMPVTLNEPLGVLQRMCEELEYSELLDAAAAESDAVERMALIAAFAVSGYSSTFFRTHKPFNPLLGETYECVREDKGFRFVSEQVSHHPPVSAGHAEGRGWAFWEETQLKTKFWGKSMEIQPLGEGHVVFSKFGEHYSYNKATTCVHNIFSAQNRWVDLYGEVTIKGNGLTANLTFLKASYWSSRKHEVFGTIANSDGTTLRNLFGNWNEAFHAGQPPSAKCLWRMGAMPEDHTKYYGFTRFAIELNELTPGLMEKLSVTDTRLRPDQRLLEEGDLTGAERMKLVVEQKQRDRRKKREESSEEFSPQWFQKTKVHGEPQWEFSGTYWEQRKGGFKNVSIESLW